MGEFRKEYDTRRRGTKRPLVEKLCRICTRFLRDICFFFFITQHRHVRSCRDLLHLRYVSFIKNSCFFFFSNLLDRVLFMCVFVYFEFYRVKLRFQRKTTIKINYTSAKPFRIMFLSYPVRCRSWVINDHLIEWYERGTWTSKG